MNSWSFNEHLCTYHLFRGNCYMKLYIELAKKFIQFCCTLALVVLVLFNLIQNPFVRLYYDSCHISMHLKNCQNW